MSRAENEPIAGEVLVVVFPLEYLPAAPRRSVFCTAVGAVGS